MGRKGQASDGPGPQPGGIEVLSCGWDPCPTCAKGLHYKTGGAPQVMAASLFLSQPAPSALRLLPCRTVCISLQGKKFRALPSPCHVLKLSQSPLLDVLSSSHCLLLPRSRPLAREAETGTELGQETWVPDPFVIQGKVRIGASVSSGQWE